MSDKKRSGCVVAVVVGLLAIAGIVALFLVFSFKAVRHGKREVEEQIAEFKAREEVRMATERENTVTAVELKEGELPDYSGYQLFQPLSREMFLAWRLDQGATSLAKEAFSKKAEGADVVWELQAGDLVSSGNQIVGDFYLPYSKTDAKGRKPQSGVEQVTCRFAEGASDSLLGIRRGGVATIRGRLSLVNDRVVLSEARLATEDVEK